MQRSFLALILACFSTISIAQTNAPPQLAKQNLDRWIRFIEAKPAELRWQEIRWHKDYESAVIEARQLKRPVLLWTMNGHPCGET